MREAGERDGRGGVLQEGSAIESVHLATVLAAS
jgi:hypothetical protein